MKKFTLVCLAVVAMVSPDRSTTAAPASVQLTLTTDSGANLQISILSGAITANVPFDFTGSLYASVDAGLTNDTVNDSTGIAFIGADIDIADVTVDIDASFLGGVLAEISGARINNLNTNGYIPMTSTNGANPFTYTFDPGGGSPTELSIDEGLFTYLGTGPAGSLIGSGTLDFAADPVNAELGSVGQIGMVTQDVNYSDGLVFITVSVPITFADTLITDPVAVDANLSGVLVATGYFVPEPSSVVLLGIAIVGLIPFWRRLRN